MIAAGAPVPLAEAREETQFGGKAVQLGAACRAGLPVPLGVAFSARLVEAFVTDEPSAAATVDSVLSMLEGPLAVRSSAIGEDSAKASFAGQHATKLGVKNAVQLADALLTVWQSGRSEGAIAYRRKLGLDDKPRMGVVVQRLVYPDIAGVLFTRNPISGADEHLIEATWGLGEAVVQGLVIPDRYRVSQTGEVIERVAGHKQIAIRTCEGGGTTREPVALDRASALCLDDAGLRALHRLARSCDEHFDGPSDIEWAFAGGTLHLLQRRPITRLAR